MERKPPGRLKRLWLAIWWALTGSWMALIFLLSAQPAGVSGDTSKSLTRTLIRFMDIFVTIDLETSTSASFIEYWDNVVREYAHAGVFLVLAVLALNALRLSGLKSWGLLGGGYLLCLLYALTDETHQLFVPGRSFQLIDLGMDALGSLIGVIGFAIVLVAATRSAARTGKAAGRS